MINNGDITRDERLPFILWEDKVESATVTVNTPSMPGFPLANIKDPATNTKWVASLQHNYLIFDFQQTVTLDCVAILCSVMMDRMEEVRTAVYVSDDGVTWNLVPGTTTGYIRRGIGMFCFVPLTTRYLRVWISSAFTSQDVYVSRVAAGERLVFPRGIIPPYTPIIDAKNISSYPRISRTGQFMKSRTVTNGVRQSVRVGRIEEAYYEEHVSPFKEYFDRGNPFFFSSKGLESWKDVAYCWMSGSTPLRASFGSTDDFRNITMEMQGYAT